MTLGGPHVGRAFVSQRRCLLDSTGRIPGDGVGVGGRGGGVAGGLSSMPPTVLETRDGC